MLLQALNQHYEVLCAKGELSVPGWDDAFKVTFGLDLSDDGEIIRLIDFREEQQRGKKTVVIPKLMRVPAHPTRTSGTVANFLCDNSSYMLGVDGKGRDDKALQCFAANKALHEKILSPLNEPAAKAILAFFRNWHPEEAEKHPLLTPYWETILRGINLIFCYEKQPVSEIAAIQDVWQEHFDAPKPFALKYQCLVTGRYDPTAVIHPQIKGVKDAQPTGAALVSFNAPSFCSYGHTQNFNAPVSERAAFAYTTALNTLLADRSRCRVIGDTTIVCWAEHGDPCYQEAYLSAMFGASTEEMDEKLSSFLTNLVKGAPMDWNGIELDENEHFYILGLSPNAARLSVRFFLKDSFGSLLRNIRKHYEDTAIIAPNYDKREHIPFWMLLLETVNQKSNDKSPVPQLAGEVLRSILMGTPYPATLLNGVHLRIRAEREITRGKAAIIKAYYSRANIPFPKEVLTTMEGNESSTNIPYTLGRLFSIYEQIQEKAYPTINASIKDKYFNSAASTPATIMPILGNLAQKHLRVIRRTSYGSAVYFENLLMQFSAIIGDSYPTRLSLPEQGAFQLGYYFENQKRYTPKKNKDMEE